MFFIRFCMAQTLANHAVVLLYKRNKLATIVCCAMYAMLYTIIDSIWMCPETHQKERKKKSNCVTYFFFLFSVSYINTL